KTNIILEERCCNTLHRLASDGLADVRSARRDGYYFRPGFVRLVGSGCRGRLALRRRFTGGNARGQGEARLGGRERQQRNVPVHRNRAKSSTGATMTTRALAMKLRRVSWSRLMEPSHDHDDDSCVGDETQTHGLDWTGLEDRQRLVRCRSS